MTAFRHSARPRRRPSPIWIAASAGRVWIVAPGHRVRIAAGLENLRCGFTYLDIAAPEDSSCSKCELVYVSFTKGLFEHCRHGVNVGRGKIGTSAVLGVVNELGVSTEQLVEQLATFVRRETPQRRGRAIADACSCRRPGPVKWLAGWKRPKPEPGTEGGVEQPGDRVRLEANVDQ